LIKFFPSNSSQYSNLECKICFFWCNKLFWMCKWARNIKKSR